MCKNSKQAVNEFSRFYERTIFCGVRIRGAEEEERRHEREADAEETCVDARCTEEWQHKRRGWKESRLTRAA